MADTFGAIELPLQSSTEPVGDPAIGYLADYLTSVINAELQDAFDGARLVEGSAVVRKAFTVDPNGYVFDEECLPALFVYRTKGTTTDLTSDLFGDEAEIRVVWMLPHDRCEVIDKRKAFYNAITKTVARSVRLGRHQAWQLAGDTEPTALSIPADPGAIKLPFATSTSAQDYSGVAFNGELEVAAVAYSPMRNPVITTAPTSVDTYNTTTPITLTVVDCLGITRTKTIALTQVRGGERVALGEDVQRVTRAQIPTQLATGGVMQIGTDAVEGRGSLLICAMGMSLLKSTGWQPQPIAVVEYDASGRKAKESVFDGVIMTLAGQELSEDEQTVANKARVITTADGFEASTGDFE